MRHSQRGTSREDGVDEDDEDDVAEIAPLCRLSPLASSRDSRDGRWQKKRLTGGAGVGEGRPAGSVLRPLAWRVPPAFLNST